MEYQTHPHITSAAQYEAVQHSSQAIQHACEQRISPEQKTRTRELGRIAQAYLALEPHAVNNGLALYLTDSEIHSVAQAALFFNGTAHYDTLKLRAQLPDDVHTAARSLHTHPVTREA